VHFIFQPAEEGGGGGRVMVEEGLFDRFPCDAVYALHNDPELPLGEARIVAGPVLAAADRISITVHGKGGHASRPHICLDPVLVGAQIVVAAQSIVSRSMDPLDAAVVSICQFHAGSAGNVIPEVAELHGTVRSFRPEVQDMVEARLAAIVRATAEAHGAWAELSYQRGYPPTVNHAEETERAARAAAAVLGEDKVRRNAPPRMGAEDFSYMLQKRPGCFIGIGQGDGGRHSVGLHNPRFDFNDDLIPLGASLFARLAEAPRALLAPVILVLSVVGTFAIQNSATDVLWMLGFGLFGYFLKLYGFEVGPVVLGMILGPLMDASYRRAMISAADDPFEFLFGFGESWISAGLAAFCLAVLAQAARRASRRGRAGAGATAGGG